MVYHIFTYCGISHNNFHLCRGSDLHCSFSHATLVLLMQFPFLHWFLLSSITGNWLTWSYRIGFNTTPLRLLIFTFWIVKFGRALFIALLGLLALIKANATWTLNDASRRMSFLAVPGLFVSRLYSHHEFTTAMANMWKISL